jgi:D-xylulose reductase
MEPLAVAVHSVANLGSFRTNQSIAIFGCGPVGLLCMAVAKALGAGRIIAIDIVPSRLEFARSYAATDTFNPPTSKDGESKLEFSKRSADQMKEQLGIQDRGTKAVDLVVDASGAEVSIQTALAIVKFGGTHIQVSVEMSPKGIPDKILVGWNGKSRGNNRHGFRAPQGASYQRVFPLRGKGRIP